MGELNETQRYLIDEHIEEYQEGLIPRRELLRRVTLISGSAALGAVIVAACGPAPARTSPTPTAAAVATPTLAPTVGPFATPPAQVTTDGVTVKPDDPRITVSKPDLKGPDGASLMAYMARPAGSARVPGVIVIQENRGQTPHIQDVVRRAATAGFAAINIDLLARAGGYEKLTDQVAYNAELGKLTLAGKLADHSATLAYLKAQSTGAIGAVGFCFGGGEVWNLVAAGADLKAAVPYYGPQPLQLRGHREDEDRGVRGLRRAGHPHHRDRAADGSRAQEVRLSRSDHHVSRREPRVPQRHRYALRRGAGDEGLGRDDRVAPKVSRVTLLRQGRGAATSSPASRAAPRDPRRSHSISPGR
jgi:carboxymethylenebutenolidase